MRILITGAAGLIGSHLCDLLLEEGHHVYGLDNLSFGNIDNLKQSIDSDKFKFIKTDCTTDFWNLSKDCLCEVSCDCDLSGFDFVFHLASAKKTFPNQSEIKIKKPKTSSWVMENNAKMIQKVFDFVKKDNSRLIFTSTSDVYGRHETFSEDDEIKFDVPTVERQTYSVTKLFEEQYLLNKFNENELKVTIARIFGCFSHRSNSIWSGGHIPMFLERAMNDENIIIHGDGKQTRSMAHVDDIVKGLILMMYKFGVCEGQIFNIGSEDEMSILSHAKEIIKVTNSKSKIDFMEEKKALGTYKEIRRRKPDLIKAKMMIGYKPKTRFKESLNRVIKEISK